MNLGGTVQRIIRGMQCPRFHQSILVSAEYYVVLRCSSGQVLHKEGITIGII
jgi:hypothetical protein